MSLFLSLSVCLHDHWTKSYAQIVVTFYGGQRLDFFWILIWIQSFWILTGIFNFYCSFYREPQLFDLQFYCFVKMCLFHNNIQKSNYWFGVLFNRVCNVMFSVYCRTVLNAVKNFVLRVLLVFTSGELSGNTILCQLEWVMSLLF